MIQNKQPNWIILFALIFLGAGLFTAGWAAGRTTPQASASSLPQVDALPAHIPSLKESDIDTVRETVVAANHPAVVEVTTNSGHADGKHTHSGIIIDSRGYILTTLTTPATLKSVQVTFFNGQTVPAKIAAIDSAHALSLLKVALPEKQIKVATLGDSTQLRAGQSILVLGKAAGADQIVSDGIVSSPSTAVAFSSTGPLSDIIQTNAPLISGGDGGALLDLQGNLVGIMLQPGADPGSDASTSGISYAISARTLHDIVPQLLTHAQ